MINKPPEGKSKIISKFVKVEKKIQNFDGIVNCYFTFHLHVAYRLQYSRVKKEVKFFMHFNATHAITFIPLKNHLKKVSNATLKYLELYIKLKTQA